ncbi:hypothetical protein Q4602_14745, partial [Paraglaciecola chathamensis]|nr:hypothetical protein [Paraglaciecola chathamensis]
SFSHAPCLSPFKLSLSDHLLTWNGIGRVAGWCVSQGMCVAAEVFSANVLKEYLINKATEEVKDHVTIRRFSSESDARKWLAEMGFETQTTQQLPT